MPLPKERAPKEKEAFTEGFKTAISWFSTRREVPRSTLEAALQVHDLLISTLEQPDDD